MARVRPRTNIYAAFSILACLIMAGGIAATVIRIQEYTAEVVKPKPLPPLPPDEEEPPKAAEGGDELPSVPPTTGGDEAAPAGGDEGGAPTRGDEGAITPAPGGRAGASEEENW